MPRNLGTTDCDRCDGAPKLTGEPHAITSAEAGVYFDQYAGMIVADAECPDCGARYLAWVDERDAAHWCTDTRAFATARRPDPELGFIDLSFRSTFNDEPGEGDLPPWGAPLMVEMSQADSQLVQLALVLASHVRTATDEDREALKRVNEAIRDARKRRGDDGV